MTKKHQKPTFLETPARPTKPRLTGVTHVLDKGMTLTQLDATMASTAEYIDVWKFGWGTAYLDPEVRDKIRRLRHHNIQACPGGTLLEISWLQRRADGFFDWVEDVGFTAVEVSNGATAMPIDEKRSLIRLAADRGLDVLAEVGSKSPDANVIPEQWIDEIGGDIDAGARRVVAEGRESGTVGLYEPDGRVRTDLVAALEAAVDGTRIIYEAPLRTQQAWLLRTIGPSVNLGNITMAEVLSVESLRQGLRADTIGLGTASDLEETSLTGTAR